MNGAENILAHVERKIGVKPGQTTPDGRYTLSVVECLGSCGTAPMMMVNEAYHENLTPAKVDELLEGLK
jgi:NADH-quinone oxidoreductase subunit E